MRKSNNSKIAKKIRFHGLNTQSEADIFYVT